MNDKHKDVGIAHLSSAENSRQRFKITSNFYLIVVVPPLTTSNILITNSIWKDSETNFLPNLTCYLTQKIIIIANIY